jgi:hypothetical protein
MAAAQGQVALPVFLGFLGWKAMRDVRVAVGVGIRDIADGMTGVGSVAVTRR